MCTYTFLFFACLSIVVGSVYPHDGIRGEMEEMLTACRRLRTQVVRAPLGKLSADTMVRFNNTKFVADLAAFISELEPWIINLKRIDTVAAVRTQSWDNSPGLRRQQASHGRGDLKSLKADMSTEREVILKGIERAQFKSRFEHLKTLWEDRGGVSSVAVHRSSPPLERKSPPTPEMSPIQEEECVTLQPLATPPRRQSDLIVCPTSEDHRKVQSLPTPPSVESAPPKRFLLKRPCIIALAAGVSAIACGALIAICMLRRKQAMRKKLAIDISQKSVKDVKLVPLARSHFPLLLKWLEAPHVKKWWPAEAGWTTESIEKKYESYVQGFKDEAGIKKPIHARIVYAGSTPVGYIQWYNAYDFAREPQIQGLPRSLVAFDIFIGEESYLGCGVATAAIQQFLEKHASGYTHAFADPERDNEAATRLYKKSGFKFKEVEGPGTATDVLWMIKDLWGRESERAV